MGKFDGVNLKKKLLTLYKLYNIITIASRDNDGIRRGVAQLG